MTDPSGAAISSRVEAASRRDRVFLIGITVLVSGFGWALMALCLAFGMMNLAWMAGLTAFVLFEKIGPFGPGMIRAAGVLLAAWGVRLIFAASTLH